MPTLPVRYDYNEACRLLGVSRRWLQDGVNHRGFPHYRTTRVEFTDDDLKQILALCRRGGTSELRPRRRAS